MRPRISFGKIAHRVGAVTSEQLAECRAERDSSEDDETLEAILLEKGYLTEDLAEFVREAFLRMCAVCPECGRRTDVSERNEGDWACRCGGTFAPLAEQVDSARKIDPALLTSETGDVSDEGAALE